MKQLTFIIIVLAISCRPETDKIYSTWRVTGGSKENIHYSTLTQVDSTNVMQLHVAWSYHTLDADTVNHSQIQCNPIVVDGILYGTSPQLKLFALDAATGKEKWVFDPQADQKTKMPSFVRFILNNNRGVTYWQNEKEKRILYAAGSFLY